MSLAFTAAGIAESIVHTGQHYDHEMSALFFEQMGIPTPTVNLGVGSGSHAEQTAHMLVGIEKLVVTERPDVLLVYGDTNSTLAGALAAAKLGVPVAHVESGLRSRNRSMPEELNRVVTDHVAELLFCPTRTAVANLAGEGITRGVHLVGDTMYDALLHFRAAADRRSGIIDNLGLLPRSYHLATIHRPYNTDHPARLREILAGFAALGHPVVFPAHPRTRDAALAITGGTLDGPPSNNVQIIRPVGYLDMIALEQHARAILTDSGGIQKEAYMLGVPCCTIRSETEWVETVEVGWNIIVAPEREAIACAVSDSRLGAGPRPDLFGDGRAAERIAALLRRGSAAASDPMSAAGAIG